MPKTKSVEIITEKSGDEVEKIIEIDDEAVKDLDDELIPGEIEDTEAEEEDDAVLDEEEVDPFKDKWEE